MAENFNVCSRTQTQPHCSREPEQYKRKVLVQPNGGVAKKARTFYFQEGDISGDMLTVNDPKAKRVMFKEQAMRARNAGPSDVRKRTDIKRAALARVTKESGLPIASQATVDATAQWQQ